jgi:inhibitor of cysteine peptidase
MKEVTKVKRIITSTVIALSILCAAAAVAYAADDSQYAVELNGTKLDAVAYDVGGTVYLPLRAVCEALGYSVGWSAEDHTVTLSKDGTKLSVNLNSSSMTEGDHQYFIGVMPASSKAYLTQDFFNDSMGLKITPDRENKSFSLESAAKETGVTIKNVNETSGDGKIDVTLNYPQISGLADQAVQDRVNSLFRQEAASAKQEGQENLKDYPPSLSPNKYETYFDYRIKYNRNNILSVIFLDYQYTGGAHGSTIQKAYTLDLQTGKEYAMEDLFKTGSDYAALFNGEVRQGIKDRELYELATFSAISADQAFYLDNSGVSVYFQQYEYFPYAAGIQTFTLDYPALKDVLDPSLSFLCGDGKN